MNRTVYPDGAATKSFDTARLLCLVLGLAVLGNVVQARSEDSAGKYRIDISNGLVTLNAIKTPLVEILAAMARRTPLTVQSYVLLDELVTLDINRLPLPAAISRLLKAKNFVLRYAPPVYRNGRARNASPSKVWIFPDSHTATKSEPRHATITTIRSPANSSSGIDGADAAASDGAAMPSLQDALRSTDVRVRTDAVADLAGLGTSEAVLELSVALGDENAGVREAAVDALGAIGDETAIRLAAQTLGDADPGVRQAAIDALGDAGIDEAVRALGLALRDPDAGLREAAIEMLGEIGGNEPVELLQLALTDGSPAVRQTAAQVLAELEAGSDR